MEFIYFIWPYIISYALQSHLIKNIVEAYFFTSNKPELNRLYKSILIREKINSRFVWHLVIREKTRVHKKMNYEKMSKNDGLETKPETRAKRVNIKTFIGK